MSRLIHTGLNAGKAKGATVVGAAGVHYELSDGRRVLDASNTGGPVGHCHPKMVEAVRRAACYAPSINEGFVWRERELAAEELIEKAFEGETDWIGGVRFFLSGSEANDAALSLAQAMTGRSALATRERAYHGMTGLSRHLTVQPHWHGGLAVYGGDAHPVPEPCPVEVIVAPVGAHYHDPSLRAPAPVDFTAVPGQLSTSAAVIIDYTQGGIYYDASYQDQVATLARRENCLWIADEVVTGLGRSGRWFAFQGGRSRPDIVTLGKPLAGGAAPAGAVVLSKALLDAMENKSWQTYSTYRGHPLAVAAIRAYLALAQEEALAERVPALSALCARRLREIAERHPSVARVDGHGLHWTVELHGPDWRDWLGNDPEPPLASRVAAAALDLGAMFGTSGERTSLFLAPPLIVKEEELESMLAILDGALALADDEYQRRTSA